MRVFLVERPRREFNISSAAEFGEVRYLFEPSTHRPSIFKTDEYVASLLAELQKAGFRSEQDALCMTGAMVPVALALFTIAKYYGDARVLMFHAHEEKYVLRVLRLTGDSYEQDDDERVLEAGQDAPQRLAKAGEASDRDCRKSEVTAGESSSDRPTELQASSPRAYE